MNFDRETKRYYLNRDYQEEEGQISIDIFNDFVCLFNEFIYCSDIFCVFNDSRWEVVVHFVDSGGIVDHHCLNNLFYLCRQRRKQV
jgi:hypothetical protein